MLFYQISQMLQKLETDNSLRGFSEAVNLPSYGMVTTSTGKPWTLEGQVSSITSFKLICVRLEHSLLFA